jgi:hypothetical protein
MMSAKQHNKVNENGSFILKMGTVKQNSVYIETITQRSDNCCFPCRVYLRFFTISYKQLQVVCVIDCFLAKKLMHLVRFELSQRWRLNSWIETDYKDRLMSFGLKVEAHFPSGCTANQFEMTRLLVKSIKVYTPH